MTTKLGCRDVEGLILEGEDRELATGQRQLVEDHLHGCEGCRAFAADRAAIRKEMGAVRWPAPSESLLRGTRAMILESRTGRRAAGLPAWVLAAMALMTVATGLWLAVSLADVTPEMTLADLPLGALAAVVVIIQNALLLFFAPVLLRAVRSRRSASESAP
jgi:predicted anti-sigma-YlaC factor YlaD